MAAVRSKLVFTLKRVNTKKYYLCTAIVRNKYTRTQC